MDIANSAMTGWYKIGFEFEHAVEDFFEGLARVVAKNRWKTVATVLLVTIFCAVGFLNFKEETDSTKLWVPQDSTSQRQRAYQQETFGTDNRGGSLLYTGTNVITLEAMEDMWDGHEKILAIRAEGSGFEDFCGIRDYKGACFTLSLLQFFSGDRAVYNEQIKSIADLVTAVSAMNYPDGTEVSRQILFGNAVVDSNDEVTSATGTTVFYLVNGDDMNKALAWEKSFLKVAADLGTAELQVYYYANRSIDDELTASVVGDIGLMIITYILMFVITCVVFAKRRSLVGTRTALSGCGIGVVIISMVAGYGVCSGVGVIFLSLHQILPFILVGIGVDDMFIIVAAFDAQDVSLPTEERLARAMRRCGLSVTFTTATNAAAFYLGATSSLPAIKAFCLYAATSVMFNWSFQITMFCALLCMDADRMNANRFDILCCCGPCGPTPAQNPVKTTERELEMAPNGYAVVSLEVERGVETGEVGKEGKVGEEGKGGEEGKAVEVGGTEEGQVSQASGRDADYLPLKAVSDMTYLEYFFAEVYWPLLTRPLFRAAIVLSFLGLFAACLYGCTQIDQGFDNINLMPDDSYVRDYILTTRDLDLFAYEQNSPVNIIIKDVPYHLQSTQEDILRIQAEFLANGDHNKGPFTSWLSTFKKFTPTMPFAAYANSDGFITDEAIFYEAVEYFVQQDFFLRFVDDINFATVDGKLTITSSRVSAFHHGLTDYRKEIRAMQDVRDLMASAVFDPKPIAVCRNYIQTETDLIIVNEMLFNLGLALVAVALVSLFVLIRPGAVLLVVAIVAVIDADLLGAMYYWNLQINTVTVVQLVMAIGLVVDYVSHVLHYFLAQDFRLTPLDRLKHCLVEIGPSVLLGCTTTFVGIVPLAFASSVIFRTFFRMFLCIIIFGAGHGLILLPAILPSLPFTAIEGAHGHKATALIVPDKGQEAKGQEGGKEMQGGEGDEFYEVQGEVQMQV